MILTRLVPGWGTSLGTPRRGWCQSWCGKAKKDLFGRSFDNLGGWRSLVGDSDLRGLRMAFRRCVRLLHREGLRANARGRGDERLNLKTAAEARQSPFLKRRDALATHGGFGQPGGLWEISPAYHAGYLAVLSKPPRMGRGKAHECSLGDRNPFVPSERGGGSPAPAGGSDLLPRKPVVAQPAYFHKPSGLKAWRRSLGRLGLQPSGSA